MTIHHFQDIKMLLIVQTRTVFKEKIDKEDLNKINMIQHHFEVFMMKLNHPSRSLLRNLVVHFQRG